MTLEQTLVHLDRIAGALADAGSVPVDHERLDEGVRALIRERDEARTKLLVYESDVTADYAAGKAFMRGQLEPALAEARAEAARLALRLDSARQAMEQANDALESDADVEKRRAAFERIQDEFDGVTRIPLLERAERAEAEAARLAGVLREIADQAEVVCNDSTFKNVLGALLCKQCEDVLANHGKPNSDCIGWAGNVATAALAAAPQACELWEAVLALRTAVLMACQYTNGIAYESEQRCIECHRPIDPLTLAGPHEDDCDVLGVARALAHPALKGWT